MHDPGCPPFSEVLSYLFSIILSSGMIGYLLLWLSAWNLQTVPLNAFVFLLSLCAIIGYSGFRLARVLFPARMKRCRVCSLVRAIIEIDGVTR